MICPHCESSKKQPWHGVYNLKCIACCARLVISARPSKPLQEGHLAAIARQTGSPSRQDILDHLKPIH